MFNQTNLVHHQKIQMKLDFTTIECMKHKIKSTWTNDIVCYTKYEFKANKINENKAMEICLNCSNFWPKQIGPNIGDWWTLFQVNLRNLWCRSIQLRFATSVSQHQRTSWCLKGRVWALSGLNCIVDPKMCCPTFICHICPDDFNVFIWRSLWRFLHSSTPFATLLCDSS